MITTLKQSISLETALRVAKVLVSSPVDRAFVYHYLRSSGRTADIAQFRATRILRESAPVARFSKDLIEEAKTDLTEKATAVCAADPETSPRMPTYVRSERRSMDFTLVSGLFSIGNTHVSAKVGLYVTVHCQRGHFDLRGGIHYNLNDSFVDALDINDRITGAQDFSTPYNFYARWVETVRERVYF